MAWLGSWQCRPCICDGILEGDRVTGMLGELLRSLGVTAGASSAAFGRELALSYKRVPHLSWQVQSWRQSLNQSLSSRAAGAELSREPSILALVLRTLSRLKSSSQSYLTEIPTRKTNTEPAKRRQALSNQRFFKHNHKSQRRAQDAGTSRRTAAAPHRCC